MRVPRLNFFTAEAPRWQRWAVVGALSLMLHVAALLWAGGKFQFFPNTDNAPAVLQTVLVQTAPPRPAMPAPPKAKPAPKPSARSAATPARTIAPAAPIVDPAHVPDTVALPEAAGIAAPVVGPIADLPDGMPFGGPDLADAAPAPAPSIQTAPVADHTRFKVAPPPSAALKYDVSALREGQTVYGHGTIGWQFDGAQYAVNGDAGVLFFSVLSFSSEGTTDAFGIAPVRYTEKRWRRDATNTHFNRERNLISFSASTNSYALQGGEQDRASIIWQLASIGRGDPERFVSDAHIPLFIAGVREGETWQIRVLGEEEIEVGLGRLRAWHVQRMPRAGSRDQKLDIWLAPDQQWYPVKLRFTEPNGEYLDMSVSAIEPLATR